MPNDDNAEKAQIRAYNEITRADYTPESIEAAIRKMWDTAIASRDPEVAELRGKLIASYSAETVLNLREQVAAERTRADEAEAKLSLIRASAVAGLEDCDEDYEMSSLWVLETIDAAAVPVEPQTRCLDCGRSDGGCDRIVETADHENGSDS